MSEFAYVIDDDEGVRVSLRALLGARDNRLVLSFASAEAFMVGLETREPGVVLVDIHMPGMSGMELLTSLQPWRDRFPVVVMTGQGDVPLAVKAMQLGAIDFLEKPYDHHALFAAVDRGFEALQQVATVVSRTLAARERIDALSPRERQILAMLVAGDSNRVMAERLGLSVRTVEVHRANLMAKLGVPSLSGVINLAHAAGIVGGPA